MDKNNFENFCQDVYSGNCDILMGLLAPGVELPTDNSTSINTADLYSLLHSLQINLTDSDLFQEIVPSLLRKGGIKSSQLSSKQLGKLLFIDYFFDSIAQDDHIPLKNGLPLMNFKVILCKLFLTDKLFANEENKKKVEQLINTVSEILMGYFFCNDLSLDHNNKTHLKGIFSRLKHNYYDDFNLLEKQTELLAQERRRFSRRLAKLEERAIESELGAMRLKHCENLVADLYNSHFQNSKLPHALYEVLIGLWHDVLLRTALEEFKPGKVGLLWKQAAQTTSVMIRSVQPGAYLKSFFSRAESVDEEITRIMRENRYSEKEIDNTIFVLRTCQKKMIEGKENEYIKPALIERGRFFDGARLHVSEHLKTKLSELQVGQKYCYEFSTGKKTYMKLAHKDDKYGYLLFFTQGGKLINRSFDEMTFQLTSGLIKQLQSRNFFQHHLHNALHTCWIKTQDIQQREHQKLKIIAKHALDERRKINKEALQEKINQVRQLREEYQCNEAERSELKIAARKVISTLGLGSWIIIHDKENAKSLAKLAVRLVSTGKLIFVDRGGIRVAEYTRQDLENLVVEGKVEIVGEADSFGQTLASVIGRLI